MSRTRILRIQSRICIGGPALNTILLSAHLDPTRYQTLLVGGRLDEGEKSMAPLAEAKGIEPHLIEEMGRSLRWGDDIRALWKLIRLMRKFRPHIVHTHTAKAGALGRLAAFVCRVPIRVHTFHGHVFHGYFSPLKTKCFIWLERILTLLSTRIIAISEAQKRDLTQKYRVVSPAKCQVIRLGFELAKITKGKPGTFKHKFNLNPTVMLVGIIARLVPIKNHRLLLQAIAHWRHRAESVTPAKLRFVIAGDGECRAQLEQLGRELGIKDLLLFTGWFRDVPDLYADLALNVLVSKNEGTPVTLIEGLACGVPILATDVGGIRDFADQDCGVIVDPHTTPEALGQKLGVLLNGKGPKPLPPATRDRIRRDFDVTRLVSEVETLYRDLLDPP